eukprot:1157623-Pelagomonas_calceolata.AAC.1
MNKCDAVPILQCETELWADDDASIQRNGKQPKKPSPHMGSAYSTIAADTAARFQRLKGRNVRFVTGTDEHGEKIAAAALSNGMSPQQHCDHIVGEYETLWGQLDIAYDAFIRTTSSKHEKLVHETLKRVWEKGDIYLSDYEGWLSKLGTFSLLANKKGNEQYTPIWSWTGLVWVLASLVCRYCVDCEEFKDDKEMDANHNCPTHLKPCQHRKELLLCNWLYNKGGQLVAACMYRSWNAHV